LTTVGVAQALLDLGARAYRTHGFGVLRTAHHDAGTVPVDEGLVDDLELGELL
jgi:hypothetical protein